MIWEKITGLWHLITAYTPHPGSSLTSWQAEAELSEVPAHDVGFSHHTVICSAIYLKDKSSMSIIIFTYRDLYHHRFRDLNLNLPKL